MKLFLWMVATLSALGMSLWDLHDAWQIWNVVSKPPPHVKLHDDDLQVARSNLYGALNRTALALAFALAGVVSVTQVAWLTAWFLILGAFLVALLAYRAFKHRRDMRRHYIHVKDKP